MLAILSPARNVAPVSHTLMPPTKPLFPEEVSQIVEAVREYAPWQLESLLDVNESRAFELFEAYRKFDISEPGEPAILAYNGMAFRNMRPEAFTKRELSFAQDHLRILSALYGVLRPLDGVLPHRLGFKKEFRVDGRDLYAFCGDKIYKTLYAEETCVLNLASMDYAQLIRPHMRPDNLMITCRFLIDKPNGPRGTVSTVRAARGLMAGYIVRNRIDDPEDVKGFAEDGYRFIDHMSSLVEYFFIKKPY